MKTKKQSNLDTTEGVSSPKTVASPSSGGEESHGQHSLGCLFK